MLKLINTSSKNINIQIQSPTGVQDDYCLAPGEFCNRNVLNNVCTESLEESYYIAVDNNSYTGTLFDCYNFLMNFGIELSVDNKIEQELSSSLILDKYSFYIYAMEVYGQNINITNNHNRFREVVEDLLGEDLILIDDNDKYIIINQSEAPITFKFWSINTRSSLISALAASNKNFLKNYNISFNSYSLSLTLGPVEANQIKSIIVPSRYNAELDTIMTTRDSEDTEYFQELSASYHTTYFQEEDFGLNTLDSNCLYGNKGMFIRNTFSTYDEEEDLFEDFLKVTYIPYSLLYGDEVPVGLVENYQMVVSYSDYESYYYKYFTTDPNDGSLIQLPKQTIPKMSMRFKTGQYGYFWSYIENPSALTRIINVETQEVLFYASPNNSIGTYSMPTNTEFELEVETLFPQSVSCYLTGNSIEEVVSFFNRPIYRYSFYHYNGFETSNLLKVPDTTPQMTSGDYNAMFRNCTRFVGTELANWRPAYIYSCYEMFRNCYAFNGDVSDWDMSRADNIQYMFYYCSAFNQNIGKWNVSNVVYMNYAFYSCGVLNQDISSWRVSRCRYFERTFMYCNEMQSDCSKWCVSNYWYNTYFNYSTNIISPVWGTCPLGY